MTTPEPARTSRAVDQARELEELAEREAAGIEPTPPMTSASASTSPASEVFSIRLPAEAAEQLREAATEQGISPGVLLRGMALRELAHGVPEPMGVEQVKAMLVDTVDRAIDRALRAVGAEPEHRPHSPAAPTPASTPARAPAPTPAASTLAGVQRWAGVNLGPPRVHQKLRDRRSA